jgi:phosphoadenosine phosphosulfate reductase
MLSREQIKEIESSSVTEAIRLVTEWFPLKVVFSSSLGQEDQVLTDIIFKNNLPTCHLLEANLYFCDPKNKE